jgi:hypothetical protein
MSLELNRTVAEILARSPPKGPPVVIAPAILSAAQLEVKDFLAGVTTDANQKTVDEAHAAARTQLTGVAVAGGEPVPPLALTQAVLDLAALTPPVAVPQDVVDAVKAEQALAIFNAVPPTPLQREAIAKAYTKVEALMPAAKPAPVPVKPISGAGTGPAAPLPMTSLTPVPLAPLSPAVPSKITVPVLDQTVAQARAANMTIFPAWESAVSLEASLIASGTPPTQEQAKTLADTLAAVKVVLPK